MIWHEINENDINLIPFNKTSYLKMLNPKMYDLLANEKDKENKQNILDMSDNFQVGMMVPTNWGPGKVVSIDEVTKKVTIKIEGEEQTFDMFELHPYLKINMHVYFKDMNLMDKKVIFNENIFLDDRIGKIKKTISRIFQADLNKVILVHKGQIIDDNNLKISECGFFDQDTLLVVINGTCAY